MLLIIIRDFPTQTMLGQTTNSIYRPHVFASVFICINNYDMAAGYNLFVIKYSTFWHLCIL